MKLFDSGEKPIVLVSVPKFTNEELNTLRLLAKGSKYFSGKYHKKCLQFLENTVLNKLYDTDYLTEEQINWLWSIKADMKERI